MPLCSQWYAAAYAGATKTHAADVRVSRVANPDVVLPKVRFEGRSFSRPLYYGIRAGYMLRPSIGLEGEFIHLKVFARDLPRGSVLQQYNISHGLNLVLGNVVWRRSIADRVGGAVRVGLGPTIPHVEVRMIDESVDEYRLGNIAAQFSGGVEAQLKNRMWWTGEYKYTMTKQQFDLVNSDVENVFATHHFVTGIVFRF